MWSLILANLRRSTLLIFLIDPSQGFLLCDSWSVLSCQVPGIPTSHPFLFALPSRDHSHVRGVLF